MAYFKNAAMNQLIDLVRTAISQISGSGTDHAKVTAAALVDLNARLEALENAGSEDFGNIVAETIDLVDFPKVAGAPTVVIGSGAPVSAPDFAGQFYIDTTGTFYMASGNSSATDWKACEMVANKRTSIRDAPNATDTAYVSELAVRTELDNKADKSDMTVTPGTGADADKTTIQLKPGTSATVLTAHQDITVKADKVVPSAAGNLASLDANGNLQDSGKKVSDFVLDSVLTDWTIAELKTIWDNAPSTPVVPTT